MKQHLLNKTHRITLWFVIVMLINSMLNIHDKGIGAYDDHNDVQSFVELALLLLDSDNAVADIDDEDSGSVKLIKTWACHTLPLITFFQLPLKITYNEYQPYYQSPSQKINTPPPRLYQS
nr:hypothetical protein [uncultured Carboxylicivirga sp.]